MNYEKLIASIMCLSFALLILVVIIIRAKRYRRIVRTPSSTIRDISGEYAKVEGVVASEKLRTAPFTGVQCVFYRCDVKQQKYGDKSPWTILLKDSDEEILLKDATGTVKVEINGAEVILRPTYNESAHVLSEAPPHLIRFLEENGIDPKNKLGIDKHLIFWEMVILPNQPILVIGPVAEKTKWYDSQNIRIIRKTEKDDVLHITDKSESRLRSDYNVLLLLMSFAVGILFLGSIFIWFI